MTFWRIVPLRTSKALVKKYHRQPKNIQISFKGVWHEIFDLYFCHDSNPPEPLINRLKYFRIWFRFPRFSITKMSPLCAAHPGDQNNFLVYQHFLFQIFLFMIDVFTLKSISAYCPFKSNQIQVKISILTPWCAICLRSVLHTAGIVCVVCCPARRFFRNLEAMIPQYVAHHRISSPRYVAHRWDFFYSVHGDRLHGE